MRAPVRLLVLFVFLLMGFGKNAVADTHFVWTNSPNPGSHFLTWDTAAHSIQDAVDAAASNDVVLVTNGSYSVGGWAVHGAMTNRVAITNAIRVQSVNGWSNTFIVGNTGAGGPGDDAVRCAYLGEGAVLAGFTLTGGCTRTASP